MTLAPWVLSVLGIFLQEDQREEVYRFDVEVRTVYADVFVTLDGQPIRGLTAMDFEVLDNGVSQDAVMLDHGTMPLATMLLLDISGSVIGDKLDQLRAAAHAFVEELEAKDEAGLMTFTREMYLERGLSGDFTALHRSLDQPRGKGETGLLDTLYAGLKLVEAQAGRPLVVLFTDGLDNSSWLTEGEVLDVLKASDAVVYAVGVEPRSAARALRSSGRSLRRKAELPARDLLQGIAMATGGRLIYVDLSTNLREVFLSILTEMRNRYLLSYQPQGVPLDGWHTLEVKLKGHQAAEIRTRPGYLVGSVFGKLP